MPVQNDLVTKSDLAQFEKRISLTAEITANKISQNLENKLNQQITELKDSIYGLVDGLVIEIRDGRQHRTITSHQISDHDQRLNKLEQKVFSSTIA